MRISDCKNLPEILDILEINKPDGETDNEHVKFLEIVIPEILTRANLMEWNKQETAEMLFRKYESHKTIIQKIVKWLPTNEGRIKLMRGSYVRFETIQTVISFFPELAEDTAKIEREDIIDCIFDGLFQSEKKQAGETAKNLAIKHSKWVGKVIEMFPGFENEIAKKCPEKTSEIANMFPDRDVALFAQISPKCGLELIKDPDREKEDKERIREFYRITLQ